MNDTLSLFWKADKIIKEVITIHITTYVHSVYEQHLPFLESFQVAYRCKSDLGD